MQLQSLQIEQTLPESVLMAVASGLVSVMALLIEPSTGCINYHKYAVIVTDLPGDYNFGIILNIFPVPPTLTQGGGGTPQCKSKWTGKKPTRDP